MMLELEQLLKTILIGLWVVDLITVAILFFVCQKAGRINSTTLTMVLVTFVGFFMLGYQAILEAYMVKNPGYNPVVNFFWYMGFVGFYIALLTYLNKLHKFKNIKIGTYGQYINNSVLVLGLIQLAQYAEIILLKTDQHMDTIYTIGIPTINIVSTIIGFYFACYALYFLIYKEVQIEELRWTI